MKTAVSAPAALDRLADILVWTVERFGGAQAEADAARLARRLEALAAGEGPKPRPCERLTRGVREASGLAFYREGSHYLILREGPERLEAVEIFHRRMNTEAHRGTPGPGDGVGTLPIACGGSPGVSGSAPGGGEARVAKAILKRAGLLHQRLDLSHRAVAPPRTNDARLPS